MVAPLCFRESSSRCHRFCIYLSSLDVLYLDLVWTETFQGRPYGVATGIRALRSYAGGHGGEWSASEWCADRRDVRTLNLCVSIYRMPLS